MKLTKEPDSEVRVLLSSKLCWNIFEIAGLIDWEILLISEADKTSHV